MNQWRYISWNDFLKERWYSLWQNILKTYCGTKISHTQNYQPVGKLSLGYYNSTITDSTLPEKTDRINFGKELLKPRKSDCLLIWNKYLTSHLFVFQEQAIKYRREVIRDILVMGNKCINAFPWNQIRLRLNEILILVNLKILQI